MKNIFLYQKKLYWVFKRYLKERKLQMNFEYGTRETRGSKALSSF